MVPNQGAKGLILVFLPDGKPGTPESSLNFPFPTVYLFLGNVFNRQGFNLTDISEEKVGEKTPKQNIKSWPGRKVAIYFRDLLLLLLFFFVHL